MGEIVVTGIGLVSALGSLESTWQRLLARESGIKRQQPFSDLPSRPLGLVGQAPARLRELLYPALRDALQDAALEPNLPDCGVVIGSSRSQQAQWERWASQKEDWSTESDWLQALPHQGAIATAHAIGSRGPVLAPMAACATGLWAIAQGFELIQTGQCDRVIVGAVEAPITPLTLIGFRQMGALADTGAFPFDRRRQGLVLGEGAAVLVLETAALARSRSAPIYGRISGIGLTADGYHVSAPEPGSLGAIAAVKHCLDQSRLTPADVDYIHAHGTSTQLNDRNEAFLINHLFPQVVPVSSTKGATGHTLGASGALGAAFCLLALKHQILPPCIGLRDPEFPLNFVRTAQPATLHHTLCFSFGFGGQNAVISFSRIAETHPPG